MSAEHFSVRERPLAIGSVIAPGNFGSIIRANAGQHPLHAQEYLFELVRDSEFALRPSRLDVAFTFTSLADARAFREAPPPTPAHVYAVEPETPAEPFLGDMVWLTRWHEARSIDELAAMVRAYWQGDPTTKPVWEALWPCALRVTREIEDAS